MDSRELTPQGFIRYAREKLQLAQLHGRRSLIWEELVRYAHECDAIDAQILHQEEVVNQLDIEGQVAAILENEERLSG